MDYLYPEEVNIEANSSSLRDMYYDQLEAMGMLDVVRRYNCTGVPVWQYDFSNVSFHGKNLSSSNLTTFDSNKTSSELATDTCEGCWSAEDVTRLVVYLVMSLMAIGGNGMVIWMVATMRGSRKVLNIYQANLAFIGIIVGSYCIWANVLQTLNSVPRLLAPIFCKMNAYVNATVLTANTLTLAAIAIDSFRAIKDPFKTRTDKRKVWQWTGILGLIWVISAAAALPFVLYSQEVTIKWADYEEHVCAETWPLVVRKDVVEGVIPLCPLDNYWHRLFYTLFSVTIYFVPMFGMVIFYTLMCKEVWCSRSALFASENFQSAPAALALHDSTKIEVVKKSLIVMVAFLICWTPLQCLALHEAWIRDPTKDGQVSADWAYLEEAVYFFAYLSSVLNPLVYGGFGAALEAIGGKLKKVVTELSSISFLTRRVPSRSEAHCYGNNPADIATTGQNKKEAMASSACAGSTEEPGKSHTQRESHVLESKQNVRTTCCADDLGTPPRGGCWV